nr:hypothetical protein [Rhodococcus sp. (in: high G+C Gram-positive bacteria)]
MTQRTAERTEFLSDLLLTATSGITYWATVTDPEALVEKVRTRTAIESITLVDQEESSTHTVTLDDVARGLQQLSSGSLNYSNMGYDETPARLRLLDKTNGDESDYDAFDADAVVQAALFGKIVYG